MDPRFRGNDVCQQCRSSVKRDSPCFPVINIGVIWLPVYDTFLHPEAKFIAMISSLVESVKPVLAFQS